jgi:hypothetical protein
MLPFATGVGRDRTLCRKPLQVGSFQDCTNASRARVRCRALITTGSERPNRISAIKRSGRSEPGQVRVRTCTNAIISAMPPDSTIKPMRTKRIEQCANLSFAATLREVELQSLLRVPMACCVVLRDSRLRSLLKVCIGSGSPRGALSLSARSRRSEHGRRFPHCRRATVQVLESRSAVNPIPRRLGQGGFVSWRMALRIPTMASS